MCTLVSCGSEETILKSGDEVWFSELPQSKTPGMILIQFFHEESVNSRTSAVLRGSESIEECADRVLTILSYVTGLAFHQTEPFDGNILKWNAKKAEFDSQVVELKKCLMSPQKSRCSASTTNYGTSLLQQQALSFG